VRSHAKYGTSCRQLLVRLMDHLRALRRQAYGIETEIERIKQRGQPQIHSRDRAATHGQCSGVKHGRCETFANERQFAANDSRYIAGPSYFCGGVERAN
jgi:hypothetical protein